VFFQLGESRKTAMKRFTQSEWSLQRKGTWSTFAAVVQEYVNLDHAEKVPEEELEKPLGEIYYLLMHGVVKDLSSTTKVQVVFNSLA